MKKLLLTISVIVSLASCETKTMIEDYRGQENLLTPYIYHFEYKGHDYILFKTERNNMAVGGIVHDPACKCKGRKEDSE